MKFYFLLMAALLTACATRPDGISPVTNFEPNRYLGKWYEIARLENRYEQGMNQTTAEYSLRDDGGINVLNSGVSSETGQRKSVEGKAYFIESPDVGSLKVSFFWPFYGGYHIIELDKENYSYAMIAGSDRDYLWVLARQAKLDQAVLRKLMDKATRLGFDTEKLIYPKQ